MAADPWSWLSDADAAPDAMTIDDYLALPEEISRRIEVVGGLVVRCQSPSINHSSVQRNLTSGLLDAAEKHDADSAECHQVHSDLDLLLVDVPFTFRRPDVQVFRCLPPDRGGRWNKPRAHDVEIVIEVVSPSTVEIDLIEKRARYAAAGIPWYWIVRMVRDDGRVASVERLSLSVDGMYVSAGKALRDRSPYAVDTADPFPITITWDALDRGM